MPRLRTHVFWLLVVLVAFPSAISAQDVAFKHLSVDDGLSATKINSVLQDIRGFIWLGTVDGLNRFDGYEVRSFGMWKATLQVSRTMSFCICWKTATASFGLVPLMED